MSERYRFTDDIITRVQLADLFHQYTTAMLLECPAVLSSRQEDAQAQFEEYFAKIPLHYKNMSAIIKALDNK